MGRTITKVLLIELNGTAAVISGTFDGQVQVWQLATGEPIGEPIGGEAEQLRLVGITNVTGAPAAVTQVFAEPDYFQLRDLATGQPAVEPVGQEAEVDFEAATVGHVRGQEVVAALDEDGMVRIWDVTTGEPVAEPIQSAAADSLAQLRLGHLHDTPIVVTANGNDPEIRVYNLDTGGPIGTPVHSQGYLSALEIGEVDGDPVIVAGHNDELHDDDKLIWVWDLATGEQLTEPYGDTTRWPWEDEYGISDLTLAELDGDPVVVSGGYDTMIRSGTSAPATWWSAPESGHGIGDVSWNGGPATRIWCIAQLPMRPALMNGAHTVCEGRSHRSATAACPTAGHQRNVLAGIVG